MGNSKYNWAVWTPLVEGSTWPTTRRTTDGVDSSIVNEKLQAIAGEEAGHGVTEHASTAHLRNMTLQPEAGFRPLHSSILSRATYRHARYVVQMRAREAEKPFGRSRPARKVDHAIKDHDELGILSNPVKSNAYEVNKIVEDC